MNSKIININVSIKMPIDKSIRRSFNSIEDVLGDRYLQPTIIPVADDMDPSIPRIQFQSQAGHTTILFTQQSIDLSTNFDSAFWNDKDACKAYIQEKVETFIDILKKIEKDVFYYTGITMVVKTSTTNDEGAKKSFSCFDVSNEDIYDFECKTTKIIGETYFLNSTLANYRDYVGDIINLDNQSLINFSKAERYDSGLQNIIDLNDRYIYNSKGESYNAVTLRKRLEYILNELFVVFEKEIMR